MQSGTASNLGEPAGTSGPGGRPELASGPTRNFQILDPLEFLAEFTQHIPPQGAHLIRGHRPKVGRGWYSNKARGMRRKAAEAAVAAVAAVEPVAASSSGDARPAPARNRSSQTWAMLIKRLYEIDCHPCPGANPVGVHALACVLWRHGWLGTLKRELQQGRPDSTRCSGAPRAAVI